MRASAEIVFVLVEHRVEEVAASFIGRQLKLMRSERHPELPLECRNFPALECVRDSWSSRSLENLPVYTVDLNYR